MRVHNINESLLHVIYFKKRFLVSVLLLFHLRPHTLLRMSPLGRSRRTLLLTSSSEVIGSMSCSYLLAHILLHELEKSGVCS